MQVSLHTGGAESAPADIVIFGVFSGEVEQLAALKRIDRNLAGTLLTAIKEEDFTGKSKQRLVTHSLGKLRQKRVAVLGLGKRTEGASALVAFGGSATKLARDVGASSAIVVLPKGFTESDAGIENLTRGLHLGTYAYKRYKSDKGRALALTRVAVAPAEGEKFSATAKDSMERASVVAEAVMRTRDLINESPMDLYPETFAERARKAASDVGVKVKIFTPPELTKMGMNLLLGVGAGSSRLPRLVHLHYTPKKKSKTAGPVVLVGKGITFDSGGLSLKSTPNMEDMKMDMSGAATVMSVITAAAKLKLPIELHAVMALAENMPSGTAIRVGDVIKSAAGKTVEVNNTDAEGRLVLADAMHYALGLKPSKIIDLATLTGACIVALGPHLSGLFSSDDAFADAILQSAKASGEHMWRMPLTSTLKDQLKSDVADMRNTGSREGGAITAALFLSEFVGSTPWVHLDIAGPATSKSDAGADSKGGSGVAVATLLDWLARQT